MSLIPKIFSESGRREYQEAKKEVASLGKKQVEKGMLKAREETQITRARGVMRRMYMQVVGMSVLGITLTVGAVGALFTKHSPEAEPKKASAPTQGLEPSEPTQPAVKDVSEKEWDNVIGRLEDGFEQFGQEVKAKIAKAGHLPPGATTTHLYAPFEVVESNRKNPIKNHMKTAGNNDKRDKKSEMRIRMENINYFSYDTLQKVKPMGFDRASYVANFNPVGRSMHLNPEINPDNLLDMLIFYHEVMHAVQDSNVRAQIATPEDFQNYVDQFDIRKTGKPRLNVLVEIDAFASELEIADLLMEGKLRSGQASLEDMLRTLRPRPEQVQTVKMLLEFSYVYFPHGISDGKYDPAFVQLMYKVHKEQGFDVFLKQ